MVREGAERVPDSGGPTIRRRRLAAELRRLRERSGLTGVQAAERLGWSVSKISRFETGHSRVKQEELQLLLGLYQVSDARRSELIILARDSVKTAWVDEAAIASFAAGYAALIYAEAEAVTIWDWEPQVVPGLLQTESYAREVMRGWFDMFSLPPTALEERVEARMRRQQALTGDQPPDFSAVIDESVIRRRYGDNATMRQQLERLAESADIPNVDIRILPFDGKHPIGTGGFTYMRFADIYDVSLPDVATAEQMIRTAYFEEVADTNKYRVTFEALIATALNPRRTRDLIISTARELWP
jgi:transcriptional regulator with XRE-family HTH domain